jgi:hypothetical protein
MSRFRLIDEKLKKFAEKLKAKLATDGSGFSIDGVAVPKELVEERRIIWVDGQIGKAIIIHPDFFDIPDISSPAWKFFNVAWLEHGSATKKGKPLWIKYLLKKVEFDVIEKNIDQLLNTSKENLEAIKIEDLK